MDKVDWQKYERTSGELSSGIWDVAIIGAGPAGAFAACQLAKRFKRILLIDKCTFPRSKVCGCCLNSAAVSLLETEGMAHVLSKNCAIPLQQLSLHTNGSKALVNLPKSYALSRSSLDAQLVETAIERGVTFVSNTTAEVYSATEYGARSVTISNNEINQKIQADVVLVADGLSGKSLTRFPEFEFTVSPDSRFGCGTILNDDTDFYRPGKIYMACAAGGYVGLVRVEDNRLDIAAALDRDFCRVQGNAAKASASILETNRLTLPQSMFSAAWTGTESLTRFRSQIAGDRILVIGDSCGYAEPFTGEGIAWALACAKAVATLLEKGWHHSLIRLWQKEHRQLIQQRQNRSNMIARGLRSSTIRGVAMPLISAFPAVASSLINHIGHPISPPLDAA